MKIYYIVAFVVILFIALTKGDAYHGLNITTPLDERSHSLQKLVNNVLQNSGSATYGWVDLEVFEHRTKNMKVEILDDKVTCINGPNAVFVKIVKKELVTDNNEHIKYMVTVDYGDHHSNAEFPNPLPITVSKYKMNEEFILNENFDPGFEGYLVCTAANKQAYLIPKEGPKVEFINPSWSIRVKLDIFRNPIAIYGRMFRIINLDNVSVLQNERRDFFFTLKRNQLYLIYYLYLAIQDQDKGTYCTLSQFLENDTPILECEAFKSPMKSKIINSIFTYGLIGSALFNMTNAFFLKKPKSKNSSDTGGDSSGLPSSGVLEKTPPFPNTKGTGEIMNYSDVKKSKRKVLAVTTLPIALGLISYNIYDCVSKARAIVNNVKLLRQHYIKAPFAYNWSLINAQ